MKQRTILPVLAVGLLVALGAGPLRAREDSDEVIRELKEEVRALRDRVKDLESRMGADAQLEVLGTDGISMAIEDLVAGNVSAPRSTKLKISGQVRIQLEDHLDSDFDDSRGDALEFVRLRTRVMFDAQVLDWLRAFVKIQDSRSFGEEHGVLGDLEGVDLKEGYFDLMDVFGLPLTFRSGRQEMLYGDQRLISTLDWHPVGRSWDGFRLMYEDEGLSSHLFVTRIDERFLVGGQDETEDFAGLYNSLEVEEDHLVDLYVLFRRNQDKDEVIAEDGTGGHEKLWTLGARFKGKYAGFDYVAEGCYQTGDHAGDDVTAYMVELGLGYTFEDCDWKPRIGVSWIWASGDDDPTDGDRNTFDPLYTFGHFYLGYMDFVNRQNVSSPKLSIRIVPAEGVIVSLDGHMFWLDESKDHLYALTGKPYRMGDPTGDADDYVGAEIDLHVKVKIDKTFSVWAGYCHFFAGEFLDDTGSDDDADFFFVQLTVNF